MALSNMIQSQAVLTDFSAIINDLGKYPKRGLFETRNSDSDYLYSDNTVVPKEAEDEWKKFQNEANGLTPSGKTHQLNNEAARMDMSKSRVSSAKSSITSDLSKRLSSKSSSKSSLETSMAALRTGSRVRAHWLYKKAPRR